MAEFKGIDAVEIGFLSLVDEGLFDQRENWQGDVHDGGFWMEVQELCNCSVAIEDLAFEDPEDGHISGTEVLGDIIREGAEMNLELKALEAELALGETEKEEMKAKDVEIEAHYAPYIEPSYVAPIWNAGWAL